MPILIDPKLSPTWAGKIAIPPYVAWLAELSLVWGQDKVKDYARKLVAISGGRLRYSEEERVVSGEFPIMANFGDALSAMWTWQPKGAPLVAVPGVTPINTDYFQLSVPEEHRPSQFGQALRRLHDDQGSARRPAKTRIAQLASGRGHHHAESILKKIKSPSRSRNCRSVIISRTKTPKDSSSKKNWRKY